MRLSIPNVRRNSISSSPPGMGTATSVVLNDGLRV